MSRPGAIVSNRYSQPTYEVMEKGWSEPGDLHAGCFYPIGFRRRIADNNQRVPFEPLPLGPIVPLVPLVPPVPLASYSPAVALLLHPTPDSEQWFLVGPAGHLRTRSRWRMKYPG